jgi:hypothetical protein
LEALKGPDATPIVFGCALGEGWHMASEFVKEGGVNVVKSRRSVFTEILLRAYSEKKWFSGFGETWV